MERVKIRQLSQDTETVTCSKDSKDGRSISSKL